MRSGRALLTPKFALIWVLCGLGLVGSLALRSCGPTEAHRARVALRSPTVDLSAIPKGDTQVLIVSGVRVFVMHRTAEEQALAASQATPEFPERGQEWIAFWAVHDGRICFPNLRMGDYDGFFDACYGVHYDLNGHPRKHGWMTSRSLLDIPIDLSAGPEQARLLLCDTELPAHQTPRAHPCATRFGF